MFGLLTGQHNFVYIDMSTWHHYIEIVLHHSASICSKKRFLRNVFLLNIPRNPSRQNILFPAKGIVGYRQIISSRLYVLLKETCSLAGRALSNTGE